MARMTGVVIAALLVSAALHVQATRAQPAAPGPVRVIEDGSAYPFDVSVDGRSVLLATHAFVGGTAADPAQLLIHDLPTNRVRKVEAGPSTYGPPTRPAGAFSPDGDRIAFAWTEPIVRAGTTGYQSNLMMTRQGPGAAATKLAGQGAVPHGWSPDGRSILFLQHAPSALVTDPTTINWLTVADASVRTIKTLEPFRAGAAAIPRPSPDGRWIAYSAIARQGSQDRDIFIIDSDGGNERVVPRDEGTNLNPVWSPDSSHLFFVNVTTDRRVLNSVAIREGGAVGRPRLVRENFSGDPLRVTAPGDLFYSLEPPDRFQATAERQADGIRIVSLVPGQGGTWSLTRHLAFLRFNRHGFFEVVVRAPDGIERVYTHDAIGAASPRWFNDGRHLIVHILANGDGGRIGGSFYRLDLATGVFQQLFPKDTPEEVRSFVGVLSPDDKTFYVVARGRQDTKLSRVVAIDVGTGLGKQVVDLGSRGPDRPAAIAVSPDGLRLALRTDAGDMTIVTISSGDVRTLPGPSTSFANPFGRAAAGSPPLLQWLAPASLAFAAGDQTNWRVLTRPEDAVEPLAFGLDTRTMASKAALPPQGLGALSSFDISPDGSRIAFSTRRDRSYGVWKLPSVIAPSR